MLTNSKNISQLWNQFMAWINAKYTILVVLDGPSYGKNPKWFLSVYKSRVNREELSHVILRKLIMFRVVLLTTIANAPFQISSVVEVRRKLEWHVWNMWTYDNDKV